jgi:hypothetical protein
VIDHPLALLARANPVPPSVTPAPVGDLIAQTEHGTPENDRLLVAQRRARLLGFVVPAVGICVTLAVAAAAILLIHHPTWPGPTHVGSRQPRVGPWRNLASSDH